MNYPDSQLNQTVISISSTNIKREKKVTCVVYAVGIVLWDITWIRKLVLLDKKWVCVPWNSNCVGMSWTDVDCSLKNDKR